MKLALSDKLPSTAYWREPVKSSRFRMVDAEFPTFPWDNADRCRIADFLEASQEELVSGLVYTALMG